MPKLNQEKRDFVEAAGAQAERVSLTAHAFTNLLKAAVGRYGDRCGVSWKLPTKVPLPGFAITTSAVELVASFEFGRTGDEIVGIFRFHRYAGDPIEPKLVPFWSFLFTDDGNATWSSVPGQWEWNMRDGNDIIAFVYRVMHEYYEAIRIA
ncbi:hypothetical protein [Burkholderia gladioli]|nr:hypothetical protein [Burkholderia gladioli]